MTGTYPKIIESILYIQIALILFFSRGIIAQPVQDITIDSERRNFNTTLEEIYIYSPRGKERLINKPQNITVFTGEKIRRRNNFDFQKLTQSEPGMSYAKATGASDIFIIRNIGTRGSGPHFEPGVGFIYADQMLNHSRLGRSGLFDIAQMRVVKGPPGSLSPKNTSLGAVIITPNAPTEEFDAGINANYEFNENKGLYTESFVSGPLVEGVLNTRFAASFRDQEQLITNGRQAPTSYNEDLSARWVLEYVASENVDALLTIQVSDYEGNGEEREISFCNNPTAVFNAFGDNCKLDGKNTATGLPDGFDANNGFGLNGPGTPSSLNAELSTLKVSYNLDDLIVTSITGFQDSEFVDSIDSDISKRQTRFIANFLSTDQLSQEIRLDSLDEERFNGFKWTVGGYYSSSSLDFVQSTEFTRFFGQSLRRLQTANVETEHVSMYGQIEYEFASGIRAIVGLRHTNESRDGQVMQTNYSPAFTYNNSAINCNTSGRGAGFRVCNQAKDNFNSAQTQYDASLQYELDANNVLYTSVATGFKSGGFNLLSGLSQDVLQSNFIFDDEHSFNSEVGGKHVWMDNSLWFNWDIFQLTVDDLQISQNVPAIVAQVINNAGQITSTGIELDITWRLTERLLVELNSAFIDTAFDSFIGAGCYIGQTPTQGCIDGVQNLSGERPSLAPEIQADFGVEYEIANMISDIDLVLSANAIYSSDYTIDVSNDPVTAQDANVKINLRVGIRSQLGDWEVALIGTNITDETTGSFASGTTSVNGPLGGGGRFIVPDPGRSLSLQFQYFFGS